MIGLICIFLEFFLPGGILAGFGGLLCFVGLGIEISKASSFVDVFIYAFIGALGTALVIWLAMKKIKNSKSDSEMFLNQDQEGFKASGFDESLIGKEAESVTSCSPSGFILVDGKRYQAVSQGCYIEKNEKVKIIDGKGSYFVIIKI